MSSHKADDDMLLVLGRYRVALEEIDRVATEQKKGAIGIAQAIARKTLRHSWPVRFSSESMTESGDAN